jgi:hypothetical protein
MKLERLRHPVSLQCEQVPLPCFFCFRLLIPCTSNSRALGHTQDVGIANETLDYMWKEARDQDFIYFFSGLSTNIKTKRLLRSYLFENYEKV